MNGIIGKKLGMTSIYNGDGKRVACTVIEAGPCVVTQVKTQATDGYNAVQIAFGDKKDKHTTAAEKGHFAKANTTGKKEVVEFRDAEAATVGDVLNVSLFEEGEFVDVIGTSKGKGFQGVVKRHGFSDSGMCDDNIGTAGRWISADTGEEVDFGFSIQDYGAGGSYTVRATATNGCSAKLGDKLKYYASASYSIKVLGLQEQDEAEESQSPQTSSSLSSSGGSSSDSLDDGWVKYFLYGSGGIVLFIVILIGFVLLARRKR